MTSITSLPPGKTSEARSRLLATASGLFYREGINSVGVDRIVSEANVTRATFYRHFPGKESLVLAYLQVAHDAIAKRMEPAAAVEDPRARLRAFGEDIAKQLQSKGFRGCAFVKAAAEFEDPESPVRRAVEAHRRWFAEIIHSTFVDTGHSRPNDATEHFVMVRDGAMVAGSLDRPRRAAQTFQRGVEGLIRHIE